MAALLAVDGGLRTGLAVWDDAGCLRTWRAARFPRRRALLAGARTILRDLPDDLVAIVVEGDRAWADAWSRAARPRGVRVVGVQAADWRVDMLGPAGLADARAAKRAAGERARALIAARAARGAPHLSHDAAEAICLGYWWANQLGW